MSLKFKRIILFARNVSALGQFYSTVLGLQPRGDAADSRWVELDAGACRLAIHAGGRRGLRSSSKIVFWARDVAAVRRKLRGRGAKLGPVKSLGRLRFCDGRDPEGNVFQLSNRP